MKIRTASNHTPGMIIFGYRSRIERVDILCALPESPAAPLRERPLLTVFTVDDFGDTADASGYPSVFATAAKRRL